jgi:DNA mismatch endonuclease (patch repair protein)
MNRSEQMAAVPQAHTRPELALRKALWQLGLRYRLHLRLGKIRPDLVFLGPRAVLFVDGCQWHGCPLHYSRPRTNPDFWAAKLAANVERDRRQTLDLEGAGWRVIRVWEHEVRDDLDLAAWIAREVEAPVVAPPVALRIWRVEALDEAGDFERRHIVDLRDSNFRDFEERPRSRRRKL